MNRTSKQTKLFFTPSSFKLHVKYFFLLKIIRTPRNRTSKQRNVTHPAEDQSDNNAYIGTAIFPAGCNTENIYLRL